MEKNVDLSAGVLIGKHLAVVHFSPQFLHSLSVAATTLHVCTEGIPADAVILGIGVDPQTKTFAIVFEHKDFPMQMANGEIAPWPVKFSHYEPASEDIVQQLAEDAAEDGETDGGVSVETSG